MLLLILLALPAIGVGQTDMQGLVFDLRTGFQSGWWLYNKGSTVPGQFNTESWDRTRHSLFLEFNGSILYKFKHFKLGLGYSHAMLDEWWMISSTDVTGVFDKYRIAERWVRFHKYHLIGELDLIQRRGFAFSPSLALGLFDIETIHPRADDFGLRLSMAVGMLCQFRLSQHMMVYITPTWERMDIWPQNPIAENEKHEFQSFGASAGIRLRVLGGKETK